MQRERIAQRLQSSLPTLKLLVELLIYVTHQFAGALTHLDIGQTHSSHSRKVNFDPKIGVRDPKSTSF